MTVANQNTFGITYCGSGRKNSSAFLFLILIEMHKTNACITKLIGGYIPSWKNLSPESAWNIGCTAAKLGDLFAVVLGVSMIYEAG